MAIARVNTAGCLGVGQTTGLVSAPGGRDGTSSTPGQEMV